MSNYRKEPQLRTNVCIRDKETVAELEMLKKLLSMSYEDIVVKAISEYMKNHIAISVKGMGDKD